MKAHISTRETQVLHLIAHENTINEIADKLYISPHTVISHRKSLMVKLSAKNTAGLVRRAFESGLLYIPAHTKKTASIIPIAFGQS